jgi:pyrroline-5-carboxylate reductase
MSYETLAFIGAGNMASSLISGLIADGYPPEHIRVSDTQEAMSRSLGDRYGVVVCASNQEAVKTAAIVVLAVKPQVLRVVLEELRDSLKTSSPLLLSIAAGIACHSIQRWAGGLGAIVRAMPNTPAMVQSGATGLYATEAVSERQREVSESILRAVGITVWVREETLIDAVTALSGSGPAYYFLLMEAMAEAGVQLGLDRQTASLLSQQTALGAGRIAIESSEDPSELRRRVTSPGGTTERAIATFEEGGFRDLVMSAMKAAKERAEVLSQELGGDA